MIARLALVLFLAAAPAQAGDATPRALTLDEAEAAAEPTPAVDETGRALPRQMTICHDPARRTCWSEAERATCSPAAHPAGRVFRILSVDETTALADALAACWAQYGER
jgi:hypothetical protein